MENHRTAILTSNIPANVQSTPRHPPGQTNHGIRVEFTIPPARDRFWILGQSPGRSTAASGTARTLCHVESRQVDAETRGLNGGIGIREWKARIALWVRSANERYFLICTDVIKALLPRSRSGSSPCGLQTPIDEIPAQVGFTLTGGPAMTEQSSISFLPLPNLQKVLVLGTKTFAEEVADLVRETPGLELAGFVENMDPDRCREQLDGLPIHWVDESPTLAVEHYALCGIGSTQRERFVRDVTDRGMSFITLQHPLARVSRTTKLGTGCVISAGAIIAAKSSLGEHVIVNRGALIGHHTTIGSLTTIGPGANIAGNCRIGQRVSVGMSAVVLNGLTIGDGSVIAAGAVVTKDVAPHTEVMGVPARVVQENIENR